MGSTYTDSGGIEKIGLGEQAGAWGTTTNNNLDIIDRLINGVGAITLSGTTHTLTTSDGSLSDGMFKVLVLGGSPSGTNTITLSPNNADKLYFVKNSSGQTVTFTQGSGGNVSISNGFGAIIFADGAGSGAAVTDLTALFKITQAIDGVNIGASTPATGAFTALTVDNVVVNGSTIGHTDDTDLITVASGIATVAGELSVTTLDIGGTNVTSTAAELNIMDGGTSATSTTVADADRVVFNDNGTMKQVAVTDLAAYFDDEITAMPNLVTTGALDSGSITSGFGTINTGSSTITTTGLISGGSLDIDNVLINGSNIGHTDDTDLITVANGIVTVAGEISATTLDIGGTNVTATAAELNHTDGVTSNIQTQINTIVPSGVLMPWAGGDAPTGFLLCHGQAVSRSTYSSLFSALGTTYGSGDGSSTFNIPDLRGRVVAGQDDMGGSSANRLTDQSGGLNGDTLGATGGSETHTLTTAQLASHTHTFSDTDTINAATARSFSSGSGTNSVNMGGSGIAVDSSTITVSISGTTGSAGSGSAHNNVQPTIILNYIIKT